MKHSLVLYVAMWTIFVVIMAAVSPGALIPGLPIGAAGHELFTDFTALYTGGMLLRLSRGPELYNLEVQTQIQRNILAEAGWPYVEQALAYINPPTFAALFVPFTHLSLPTAYHVWHLINLGLLLATIAVVLRVQGISTLRAFGLAVLAALSFWPVFFGMIQGQSSFVILFALGMTYAAWKTGREGWAGIALSLALVKPHFVVLIIVVALYQRRWRSIASFSLASLGLALAAWYIVGTDGMIGYTRVFLELVEHGAWPQLSPPSLSNIYANIQQVGSLYTAWSGLSLPAISATLLIIGVVTVLLASTLRVSNTRVDDGGSLELQLAYTIIVSLLITPNVHLHDFSLLVLVGLLLVDHFARAGRLHTVARIILVGQVAPVLLFTLTGEVLMAQLLVSALLLLLVILSISLRGPRRTSVPVPLRPHHR